MQRKHALDGTVKGHDKANVMLDTRTYDIELPVGHSDEYTAHMIAENIYAQCGEEGSHFNFMECIVDHKTDAHALDRVDMHINHGNNKQVHKTTHGWNLCVEWKDGKTSWK
jgi:hypothetical protein